MHVEFSKIRNFEKLAGFKKKNGMIWTAEDKNYEKVDIVSPFLEAIVVRFISLDIASSPLSFVRYVKEIYVGQRYCKRPEWTAGNIDKGIRLT